MTIINWPVSKLRALTEFPYGTLRLARPPTMGKNSGNKSSVDSDVVAYEVINPSTRKVEAVDLSM